MSQGFAQHASGLFVPPEQQRDREVWTWDEWRVLERATKLLESKNLKLQFACKSCANPIDRVRRLDGGITFRCDHLDREVTKYGR